jgi:carbon-monoxide dehydrogenase large subunit
MIGTLIGASVKRVEDPRFLTGQGQYIDDFKFPHMAHAAFLRSAYAHARITVDVSQARTLPGVIAVFTAADIAGAIDPITVMPLPGDKPFTYTALATDKVRLVGDLIAMVVAESRYLAEDALDLIQVDYDPLPPVPSIEVALDPASAPLYEEIGSNIIHQSSFTNGDVDAAFSAADHVIKETFREHRYLQVPMETRGGVAMYDKGRRELTYYTATQAHHATRLVLSMQLNLPIHHIRVIAPDMGGSFGLKASVFREDMLVAMAALKIGRPVKWIEDRHEHLLAGGHARGEQITVEMAIKKDGTILGLRAKSVQDSGSYQVPPAPWAAFFSIFVRFMLPGPYRFQNYHFESTIVATNTGPYTPYRGPWAVEAWTRETLIDIVAKELGLDPVAVRLKNLITWEEQPFRMASGTTLSRVNVRQTLERALELVDLPRYREEQKRLRAQGRVVGFGLATFIEPAPAEVDMLSQIGGAREMATVRIEPTGQVTVMTAQQPHGQSHETTLAQVVASELGVPFESVKVVHGDTQTTPFSLVGTGGSRAATMASGAALFAAREVKKQVFQVASFMLEASADDLNMVNGIISVRGVPQKALPLERIAMMVHTMPGDLPPGVAAELVHTSTYDGGEGGFSQATHCCWVEIDPGTGKVEITRYLVVEDCGTMINPAVVEGQIRGGVAQGIGGVLYEHAIYDKEGQFLTSTFMDYLIPTATEVPLIEIEHLETPPASPVNFRGVGEGGAICAPPAITNAISDALGAKITQLPITPTRILELMGAIPAVS